MSALDSGVAIAANIDAGDTPIGAAMREGVSFATEAGLAAGAGFLGYALGGACGPLAFVCSPVLGFGLSAATAYLLDRNRVGDRVATAIIPRSEQETGC